MGRRRAEPGKASSPSNQESSSQSHDEPAGRHFKSSRHTPLWLRITAFSVAGVLVLGLVTAGVLFFKLQSNVTTSPLNAGVGNEPSNKQQVEETGSLQILILGTDTRDGKNSEYGTADDSAGEGHSDVMLLMDISPDNSRVSVTSFPRDLMVPIPKCKSAVTGKVVPGEASGQLNAALESGPGCTVAAINDMTGLTIDHFMLADFTAVKELSNALGGVEVCVDHAMDDFDGSHLKLPKGKSLVKGEQALAFLRTRHSFGESSDLDRIKAQQYFLGSMVRKVKSEGTLTNLPKLYNLADVLTKNLTIDDGLANIPAMVVIANRLAKIDLAQVSFVTVPTKEYVGDPNRVQLMEPQAGQFFAALRAEKSLTGPPTPKAGATSTPTAGAPGGSAATTPSSAVPEVPAPSAAVYDKALQPISVANASAVVGRSVKLLKTLTNAGFTNAWQSGDIAPAPTTQLLYGPNMADVAADVAALFKLPATAVVSDPTVNGLSLVVGTDWTSGAEFGKIVVPKDIVASTAANGGECLTVNPLYYTD
ncbi:LCP family protein [Arthrobacter sp. E3]|uniref:LCP family protein n=1 Tax=Arthrobacter sp. E3 TaxID=517402 RepID=UPI001A93F8D1|nr:LCP family protein [Arthrobacter sp. E3]